MSVFTIGVTGHRDLPDDIIPYITRSIKGFFADLCAEHTDMVLLSSLAEGADALCAKLALESGIKLVAPLPMSAEEYRKDFSGNAAREFDCLLSKASESFRVNTQEPVPDDPRRGFYYRQAGIYVASNCDVLLAVWNGIERNTPDKAGTWETIKLAREYGKRVVKFWRGDNDPE